MGLPRDYPNTTKQLVSHCYPLPSPVKVVDDKLDFSPAGLGFRRRGALECRNPTKRYGLPYHVCTSVIWIVYVQDSLTLCVSASPTSTSLSSFWTYSLKLPDRTNQRESCQECGYSFVLGLTRAYPNTTEQLVSHCYPLPAPVKVVDDTLDFSPAGLGFRRRGAFERRNPTKR